MAMGAAVKLRRVLGNVRRVVAMELLCAAQGLDFRLPLRPGEGVARAHDIVRSLVPHLEADRVMSPDIERLAEAVASGAFAGVTE